MTTSQRDNTETDLERGSVSLAGYRCCLDDQPDHLVPEGVLNAWYLDQPGDGEIILSPSCERTSGAGPEGPHNREESSQQGQELYLKHPGYHGALPFWMGPELRATMDGLFSGRIHPGQLPEKTRERLMLAGILVLAKDTGRLHQAWLRTVERCSEEFRNQGYTPVSDLIHPFHVAALRRYYRRQIRTGALKLGDSQSSRRYIAHNDPVASFFHRLLAPAVSALTGEHLVPSYCYLASYQPGAILEKHLDREQCEISMTFCLDYSPEPRRETAWPIHLHVGTRDIAVYQSLGDSLLYRGCQIAHSRSRIPDGHTSTSLLFHYVRANFVGALN